MNSFLDLNEAAMRLGFGSGAALRKSFERGLIPGKYLVRIGARVLRVDILGFEAWLKEQRAYPATDRENNDGSIEGPRVA